MKAISSSTLARILWALVLVTLPVTSFRFMPFLGSGTYVRPLALYPLAALLPILIYRLLHGQIKRPWPGSLTILLAFLLATLAATAIGATLAPIELRSVDFFDRALRAFVTLALGLGFFIAALWMNQDSEDIKFSVRWLMVGLVAHLLWGAVQFVGLNTGHRKQLLQIQNLFSVRGLVKNKRVSGFAYEPSWLAGQIATLYLPWLLGAILARVRTLFATSRATSGGFNLATLSKFVEPLLFLAALALLLMTYSRSGLLIAVAGGLITLAIAGHDALGAAWDWLRAGFDNRSRPGKPTLLATAWPRVFLILAVIAALAGTSIFLADKGYIAAFFKSEKTDILSYVQDVYLGPRLAYATAALKSFEKHPLTGVGLGASGFEMMQNMPDWVLSGEPEIARQMSPSSNIYPNPKNIYVRLLAETGLTGFILFLAFYLSLFGESLGLLRSGPGDARWLAAAGIFTLVAVVFQGFSQDSFAMPEMWINLGILAGAAASFTHK